MKYTLMLALLMLAAKTYSQKEKILWTAAWSPDDAYIAIGGDQGDLKLFDGKTFELLKTYPMEGLILSRLKWHPHEPKLAVVTQSTTFKAKILDVEQDQWMELTGLQSGFRGLDWNYSGEYLAVSEFEGPVSIFDLTGKQISTFIGDPKGVAGLDWHPKKNIIATVGSQIGIYDYKGDTLLRFEPREVETFLLSVEWHQSGDFFAVGDYGDLAKAENKLIQFWTVEGKLIQQIEGSTGEYRNIRWSPDGKKLAAATDALRIWNKDGELLHESESSSDYLWGIDWNSTGNRIITTSQDGVISLWDESANLVRHLNY